MAEGPRGDRLENLIEGSFEQRFQGMIYGNVGSEKGGTVVGSRSASGANVLKDKNERESQLFDFLTRECVLRL